MDKLHDSETQFTNTTLETRYHMICGVHGFIGAALGSLLKNRKRAFWAGVASHAVADLLPHHDLSPEVEALIAAGSLGVVAVMKGTSSPEFWGAVGAMLPDAENGLYYLRGKEGHLLFPTHLGFHGPDTQEIVSQAAVVLASLALIFTAEPAVQPR